MVPESSGHVARAPTPWPAAGPVARIWGRPCPVALRVHPCTGLGRRDAGRGRLRPDIQGRVQLWLNPLSSPAPPPTPLRQPRSDHGSAEGTGGRKRRRAVRRPKAYDPMSSAEELALRDALHRSKHQVRRTRPQLREAPVFRPSLEEFRDPLAFIRRCAAPVAWSARGSRLAPCHPPDHWRPLPASSRPVSATKRPLMAFARSFRRRGGRRRLQTCTRTRSSAPGFSTFTASRSAQPAAAVFRHACVPRSPLSRPLPPSTHRSCVAPRGRRAAASMTATPPTAPSTRRAPTR